DKVNILLVDDHKMVRGGLKYYFLDHAKYAITKEVANGIEAIELLSYHNFDIVITDISMPEMDGVELVKRIKSDYPEIKVIALTMISEAAIIKKMMEQGVDGYVLKNCEEDEVFRAIDAVTSGQNYFSQKVTEAIINSIAKTSKLTKKQRLTVEKPLSSREKDILKLILKERTNQEIADDLFISTRTVDSHKRNMLDKTGCKNIAGLVLYAIENAIFPDEFANLRCT
ncbi:unnamed protein product, partial [Chrysoparadoxa australica]